MISPNQVKSSLEAMLRLRRNIARKAAFHVGPLAGGLPHSNPPPPLALSSPRSALSALSSHHRTLLRWHAMASPMSTVATSLSSSGDSTSTSGNQPPSPPTNNSKPYDKSQSSSNVFLDNLGTIFLTAIGLVIASLIRSFYGSSRKTALVRNLEEEAALDPLEVDDLRFANPFISPAVFLALIKDVRAAFPDGQATYKEVVHVVRRQLQRVHHLPTLELGHLLDRTALHLSQAQGITTDQAQPVTQWLVLLSLAVNAPVPDKLRVLYEILASEKDPNTATVTVRQVRNLVGYLQATSQLACDTQVLPTPGRAYPVQAYHQGTPEELLHWGGGDDGKNKSKQADATTDSTSFWDDPVDMDALAQILRSKSVCYQGECYASRKFV